MLSELGFGHVLHLVLVELALGEDILALELFEVVVVEEVGSSFGGDEVGSGLEWGSHLSRGHLGVAEGDDFVGWGEEVSGGVSFSWDHTHLTEQVDEFVIVGWALVDFALLEWVQVLCESTGFVVETTRFKLDTTSDTFDDSLPFVLLSALTFNTLLVSLDTTKEVASILISPHVDVISDLASWNLSG